MNKNKKIREKNRKTIILEYYMKNFILLYFENIKRIDLLEKNLSSLIRCIFHFIAPMIFIF